MTPGDEPTPQPQAPNEALPPPPKSAPPMPLPPPPPSGFSGPQPFQAFPQPGQYGQPGQPGQPGQYGQAPQAPQFPPPPPGYQPPFPVQGQAPVAPGQFPAQFPGQPSQPGMPQPGQYPGQFPGQPAQAGWGTPPPPSWPQPQGAQAWGQPQASAPFDAAAAMRTGVKTASGLFGGLGDKLGSVLGLRTLEGLQFKTLFSDVTRKHTEYDVEQMFLVGTQATPIANPDDPAAFMDHGGVRWPKPWLFARILLMGLAMYAAFRVTFEIFKNANLLPGMQIIAAFAVPLAVVVFYFEMNAPRNVPLYVVIKYVVYGGIASLAVSLIGFSTVGKTLTWASASAAGPIEEVGKALALILVVRNLRYPWTLNGLLFGGAIGAGFAGFETAGYALTALVGEGGGIDSMVKTLTLRALLAPGGHVAWTAIVGAALWRVKGREPFRFSMVTDRRFLSAIGFTIVIHAVWNSPVSGWFGLYTVPTILMVISWMVLLMYVQHGLREWGDGHPGAAEIPTPAPAPVSAPVSAAAPGFVSAPPTP